MNHHVLDITTETSEQELQHADYLHTHALLEQILSTTQAAIFWKDTSRRFLGANSSFLKYYGFPSEQVILGKTDEDMGWHEDDMPFRMDEMRVLQTGESTYRVHGKCKKQGELRDIVASKSPLIENGKIVGLVGTFEDVTEDYRRQEKVMRLNEQLSDALKEAENANRAKTAFLSNVSHDMRTPLNGILGMAELALQSDNITQIKAYLKKIMTSGSLLQDLINDTLELSRIANEKQEPTPEIVDADHMLDDLTASIQSIANQKQVQFHSDLQLATLGQVRLDCLKLSKVLLNLLSNAVKFTPPGGEIWLTGRVISVKEDSKYACRFEVKDTGIGMSEAFLSRMFEPFEQEHALPKSEDMGTGLGLTIARQLMDILGGTIQVESRQGKGSTFTLELTLETVPDARPAKTAKAAPLDTLRNRHILVCEDNPLNQEIITTILEMNHMIVTCAENGETGLQAFQQSEVGSMDAILMDIRMPVLDGLAATKKIREMPRKDAEQIPIIALSANAFQKNMEESKAVGMNEHLTKPIETKKLLNCLAQHISNYDQIRAH